MIPGREQNGQLGVTPTTPSDTISTASLQIKDTCSSSVAEENVGSMDNTSFFISSYDEEEDIEDYTDAIPEDTVAEVTSGIKSETINVTDTIDVERGTESLEDSSTIISSSTITEINSRTRELQNLLVVNRQTMVQASKGIQLCKNLKSNLCILQRVEFERLILLSAFRKEAVAKQLEYLTNKNVTKSKDASYNFGTVVVTNLVFPSKDCRKGKKKKRWYVCILSCDTEVFATAPTQADDNGNIVFHKKFEIRAQSSQFELRIMLYGMHLKEKSLMCFKPTKTDRTFAPPPLQSDCWETSFILYGSTIIRINNMKGTDFCLPQFPKHPILHGSLSASFSTKLTFRESRKGFLNVGKKTSPSNPVLWDYLWCCLEGKVIKCFTYPDHEDERRPQEMLTLDTCTSGAVRVERPKTLLLEIMEDRGEGPVPTKIYLSSHSADQIETWEETINSVVNVLTSWKY